MRDHNLSLKGAALLIAVLLTYAVHRPGNERVVSLFVPVELKNAPEDKVLVKSNKKGVQVTLKGPSFLIKSVASSPPPLTASLPDNFGDRVVVSFRGDDISLPRSVEVESIEPPQMEFVFEAVERRDVRIEVPRLGQLNAQLTLDSIEVNPKSISVKGPRSDLRSLKTVETDPINLSDITGSVEMPLALRALGPSVSMPAKSVTVRVVVSQVPARQEFKDRPVELRSSKGLGTLTLHPSAVTVVVSGSSEVLGKIDVADITPFIRLTDAPTESSNIAKVQVDVPDGCRVVSVEPATIAIERQAQGRKIVKRVPR